MRPPRPRRGFFPLISLPHTQFHLRIFLISFRFGFFACFSLSAPTPRVFPLIFYPAHPVLSSYLSDQLPVWGFFLAFLCLRPRRGFFPFIFLPHTQFHLRIFPISFRFGFFCLLFSAYAHTVGFPAYFPTFTPSFRSPTYRLASGVGFSACFSHPTPMPWVFPPTFLLPRPNQ